MIRLATITLITLLAGCTPAPDQGGSDGEGQPTTARQDEPQAETTTASPVESEADAARRVEVEALRNGAPGVTTPVYDPRLADEPGQSFATREEAAEFVEERERRRQNDGVRK